MQNNCGTLGGLLALVLLALCKGQSGANLGLQQFVEEKEERVIELAEAAEEAYRDRHLHVANCTCTRHRCSNDLGPETQCSFQLPTPAVCRKCEGAMVDFTSVLVDLAPGSNPANLSAGVVESICSYRTLESAMTDVSPNTWLYVSSVDGTFVKTPVRPKERKTDGTGESFFEQCSSYDPRIRPWYIASSTGPKDVVILLDVSQSMGDPKEMPRLTLAKEALLSLLNTFTLGDYINIVTFHNTAVQLWDESPLMQAIPDNLDKLEEKVKLLKQEGGTDFNNAFDLAFKLLLEASQVEEDLPRHSSQCTRQIIFLTDGKDCSRQRGFTCSVSRSEGPERVLSNIEAHQDQLETLVGSRALVFTVSMGADAEDSLPRQIACANQGAWSFVEEGDDPLERMRGYYTYIAAGRHNAKPVWVYPYLDSDGLGNLTTVSKAFYAPDTKTGIKGPMIGVVGYDVSLSELQTPDMTEEDVIDELVKASTGCTELELDGCQLQRQRIVNSDSAACPDRLPSKKCYEFEDVWYVYFKEKSSWNKAQSHCKTIEGNLASVRDKKHLSLLASISNPGGSWLGATRIRFSKTNSFSWLNKSISPVDGDSEYWALPGPRDPGKVCALIDPRGDTRNMAAEACTSELSFICELAGDKPSICGTSFEKYDPAVFYEIPSFHSCQKEEEGLRKDRDSGAAGKNPSDVICDLGITKPYAELACCMDC